MMSTFSAAKTHCASTSTDQYPARHSIWYFQDGNCIFLIENTLFNLHRFILTKHSLVFRALFELPQPKQAGKRIHYHQAIEGSNDEHPIELNGIRVVDIEPFLTLLYLPIFETDSQFCVTEWVSILDLATRWDFAAIRQHAISRLDAFSAEKLSPVMRLFLAAKFDLSGCTWLFHPLEHLVTRKEPLSMEDARLLGMETIVLVARAREEVRATIEIEDEWCDCCERCGKTSLLEEGDIDDVISEIFGVSAAPQE